MKIALTHPTYWPYVKRGERFTNGLARYLAGRGHEMTVITTKPGRPRTRSEGGLRIRYQAEHSFPVFSLRFRYHMVALSSFRALLGERFDVVQSIFYTDAFGASLAGIVSGHRNIFYVPTPDPFHLGGVFGLPMYRHVTRSAHLLAPSNYLRDLLKEHFRVEAAVIPPGIDTGHFQVPGKKDPEHPRILCVAEISAPRKRVRLLAKAFELLKEQVPSAILQLSGRIDPSLFSPRELFALVRPGVRNSIELLGITPEKDLPALYANASITVLPSVKETFGMALVESLAAGTPVVGTREGGIPEVICDPRVGVMFEGKGEQAVKGLRDAMLQCLDLAKDPATSTSCRNHSMRFDWAVAGPRMEQVYREIL